MHANRGINKVSNPLQFCVNHINLTKMKSSLDATYLQLMKRNGTTADECHYEFIHNCQLLVSFHLSQVLPLASNCKYWEQFSTRTSG